MHRCLLDGVVTGLTAICCSYAGANGYDAAAAAAADGNDAAAAAADGNDGAHPAMLFRFCPAFFHLPRTSAKAVCVYACLRPGATAAAAAATAAGWGANWILLLAKRFILPSSRRPNRELQLTSLNPFCPLHSDRSRVPSTIAPRRTSCVVCDPSPDQVGLMAAHGQCKYPTRELDFPRYPAAL